jgi:BolA family transcriptional regulator, general stress-responsive regulator
VLDESAQHAGHAGASPGGNTHWKLTMVSAAFAGKPTVARHRMIYQALGELMQNPIHALSISAKAPGENDA